MLAGSKDKIVMLWMSCQSFDAIDDVAAGRTIVLAEGIVLLTSEADQEGISRWV